MLGKAFRTLTWKWAFMCLDIRYFLAKLCRMHKPVHSARFSNILWDGYEMMRDYEYQKSTGYVW